MFSLTDAAGEFSRIVGCMLAPPIFAMKVVQRPIDELIIDARRRLKIDQGWVPTVMCLKHIDRFLRGADRGTPDGHGRHSGNW